MGLLLSLATLGAMAGQAGNEASVNTPTIAAVSEPASTPATDEDKLAQMPAQPAGTFAAAAAGIPQLPPGVTTEQNPMKVAFMARSLAKPAFFRPNQNMPEITNEDLLRGYAENGKASGRNVNSLIGYMPKLKVLPCPVDCNGSDYDKAVAAFIDGYEGEGNHFQHRGEMIVQVRWFHQRPWYQHAVPYGADIFGVEFMLEGKVISLGKHTVVAGKGTVDSADLARDIGARMAAELAFTLGMGVKPSYIYSANDLGQGVAGALSAVNTTIDGVLGVEDVRPRIEPATDANNNLLPAIDGIQPNEIEPITGSRFIGSIMF
jgi:hypothetical protein